MKFRIADHNLDSNNYTSVKEEKVCSYCKSGIQGNEIHVFQCEHFIDARIKYDIDEMTYTEIISAIKQMDEKSCLFINEVVIRTQHKSRVYQ